MFKPVVLLSIFAAACATVADLRGSEPFIQDTSSKSVQTISACLADQWASRSGVTSTTPRANGYSLTLSYTVYSSRIVAAQIDIEDLGASRSITVYARKGDDNDKLRGEVASCV